MSAEEYKERIKNTGRNDTCPCGSGKKYKKCHLPEDEKSNSEALAKALEDAAAEAATGEEPGGGKEEPAHHPEEKGHKEDPKVPRPRPAASPRQIYSPRKVGTS
jgi:hypothetical protein